MSSQERLQILKMIETKQISAEEGMKLIEAMDESAPEKLISTEAAQWMRVRVREGSKTKVNVNLPIALLEVALDIGMKFIPEEQAQFKNINVNELMRMIKKGARGKLVEVEDGDTNVEIIIE